MNKKKLFVVILSLSAIMLTACGAGKKTTAIDVNDLIEISFSGLSTEGKAKIDTKYLTEAVENAVEENLNDGESLTKLTAQANDAITITASPDEGLSNGDTIAISAEIDAEAAKEAGIVYKFSEYTETAEGLEEPVVLSYEDIEDAITIEFSGTSPYVTAEIKFNESSETYQYIDELSWGYDTLNNLAIGDTVTIFAMPETKSNVRLEDKAESFTYEFTVEGVDKYIDSTDDLTDGVMDVLEPLMNKKAEEKASKGSVYVYDEYDKRKGYYVQSVNSIELYSVDLYTEGPSELENNFILFTYKVNMTSKKDETFDYYIGINAENVVINADGTCEEPVYGSLDDIDRYAVNYNCYYDLVDSTYVYYYENHYQAEI